MTSTAEYRLDRLIILLIFLSLVAGTRWYYQLFVDAADAEHILTKLALGGAAFLAVIYSMCTFIIVVLLPLTHFLKWMGKTRLLRRTVQQFRRVRRRFCTM